MKSFQSLRALAVAFLSAAGVLAAGGSQAQSISQPPVVSAVDGNGVNLADGTFQLPGADVAIGGSSSGIARVTQGAADNYSGLITLENLPVTFNGSTATEALLYMRVSLGGATHRFLVGHYYASAGGATPFFTGPYIETGGNVQMSCSGANTDVEAHSGTCTLTLPDGTTAVYDKTRTSGSGFGPLQTINRPDGEVVTLTYAPVGATTVTGVLSVNSTLGWMLKYQGGGVTALNSAATWCDPNAASCSVAATYPSATVSTSGATNTIARNGATVLTYSTSGGITTLTSPMGVTKTVTATNNKVSSVVVGGSTWGYGYSTDASGNVTTTVSEPNGASRTLTVSYDHKIVSQTDEFNRKTSYLYDTNGRVTKVVNPDGNASTGGYTAYVYDARGNVTNTSVVPKGGAGNANSWIVTSATYPTYSNNALCPSSDAKFCNKPVTTTDANGVVTTYAYDAGSGNPATVTNAAGGQTRYFYNQITPRVLNSSSAPVAQLPVWRLWKTSSCMTGSLAACVNGTNERVSLIAYSPGTPTSAPNSNPTSANVLPYAATSQRGDGSFVETSVMASYDNNGNVLSSYGPKGAVQTTYTFYDALNRPTGSIGMDPDGSGARNRQGSLTIYDADGHVKEIDTGTVAGTAYSNLTAMTVQERNTNEFDGYGRPTVARHFIGTAATAKDLTQRSYDNMQRLDCEAVRLNSNDFGALPAACSLGTTSADGSHDRITKYGYDAASNVTSVISAYGTASARNDAVKSYDTGSATSAGTLIYAQDANGNRTNYSYDLFNRLTKTCYPNSASSTDCEQTTYRTNAVYGGGLTAGTLVDHVTLRDGSSVISLGYDGLGRVTSKSGAISEAFTYDNFDQVLTHTNSSTNTSPVTETYVYNALGWLMSDAQLTGTVSYAYDAYGKRSQMTYPGGFFITYGYDDGDELTTINENGTAQIIGFDYDDYGRRSHLYRGNGQTTTYSYDTNLRLAGIASSATTLSFTYNGADQIKTRTNSNTSFNYTTAANTTTTYGINTLNQIATVNGGTTIAYDARGNLTNDGGGTYTYNANNLLTSAVQSGYTTTLTYDAENRLSSTNKSGVGTTKFLYDGSDLIAEYDAAGGLLRRYVHGPGDDEPLVFYDNTNGTKNFLHADDNGSIVWETNASGGQVAINTFNEYGLPGNVTGRFLYTGQMWIPEIGMYYYKARLYNPAIGRFMQTDPIGYGDGMNWYNYVHSDPVNGTDPSGMDQCGAGDSCQQPVVITASCWSNPSCAEHRQNRLDLMQMNSWSDLRRQMDQCSGNVACGQYWQHRADMYADNTVTRNGFLTYAAVISSPTIVYDGVEIGLAFTASKARVATEVAEGALKACGCFVEGTQVETVHGLVSIERIKVGDTVLAYDEQTGQLKSEPVLGLIRPKAKPTFAVVFKDAQGKTETFRATADHPWLTVAHQWVHTENLKAGERIEAATGEGLVLVSIKLSGKVEHTYTLEVQGLHTFLVGKYHLVVHNSCTWIADVSGKSVKVANKILSTDAPTFMNNLKDSGFVERVLSKGAVELTKAGSEIKYVVRSSDSFGTAVDVYNNGTRIAKYGFH